MRPFLRFAGFAILFTLLASATRADVMVRYHTDLKQNSGIGITAQLNQVLGGMRDTILRIKGNKAYSSQGNLNSIMDLTTQDVILLDVSNKRFAAVPAAQFGQQLKASVPPVPEQASAALASMKTSFESHSTGRTAVIQGIQAEEQEFVLTMDMALPGAPQPASPLMKMVMQVWTAKPEETQRVPALQELKNYSAIASFSIDSSETIKQIVGSIPGMGDGFGTMLEEIAKKGIALRTHTEIVMPFLVGMMQQLPQSQDQAVPAGLDPNAPLMQMTQEVAELSFGLLDDALFEVPADYQQTSADQVMKGAVSATPPPQFKP